MPSLTCSFNGCRVKRSAICYKLIVIAHGDDHPDVLRIVAERFAENVESSDESAVFFTFHFEKSSVGAVVLEKSERGLRADFFAV